MEGGASARRESAGEVRDPGQRSYSMPSARDLSHVRDSPSSFAHGRLAT